MAISTSMVLEVRVAGNDTNGGGFTAGASGTDYSQQNSKNSGGNNGSTTDAVTAATTTVTSATASFTSAIIGNLIYLSGGTGSLTADWYEVTGFTNSTTIAIDRAPGVSTGVTMNIGGALASIGTAGQIKAANGGTQGINVWVKSGGGSPDYTITTATQNTSGGPVYEPSNTASGLDKSHLSVWEGYQTTRGDLGTKPTIKINGGVSTLEVFKIEGRYGVVRNFDIDCNAQTSTTGVNIMDFFSRVEKSIVRNSTVYGIVLQDLRDEAYQCWVTGASGTAGIAIGTNLLGDHERARYCVVSDCSCIGFKNEQGYLEYCISDSNTTGFMLTVAFATGCVAYGNSSHGFDVDGDSGAGPNFGEIVNCIAEGNGGWGFNRAAPALPCVPLQSCAGYNNTSGNFDSATLTEVENFVAGSASFFTNAASGDFSLNNTAGGGAAARGAGVLGVFPNGTTTGYADIGAAQHLATGTGDSFISMCYPLIVHGSANTAY